MITVTAFRWVPPFAQGLVKDMRVRWALEEAGLPYETRLIGPETQETPAYLAQQPFGQVPVYEEAGLVLFESGAIVQHIAQKSSALMPPDPEGRARVSAWMFAALNSVEPHVQNLAIIDGFYAEEEWAKLRRQGAEDFARRRLGRVAAWLKHRDWLEEERFTAADLLMATVLQILRDTDLVDETGLRPYLDRCEDRHAYRKALADQLATFAANEPQAA
jgi:glutathione S-transferase